jgi:hypothetical protein
MTGAVVGVVSRGPNGGNPNNGSGCVGTQHTFMKTSSFADLVNQAFAVAGGAPWIEGQPMPGQGGAGGGGGADAGAGGSPPINTDPPLDSGCAVSSPHRSGSGAALLVAAALAIGALRRRG